MKKQIQTIKVGEKNYEFVNNLLAAVIFEQISSKPFTTFNNLTDLMVYFYSCIVAANQDIDLDIVDFMSEVDEKALEAFSKMIAPSKPENVLEAAKKAKNGEKKTKMKTKG